MAHLPPHQRMLLELVLQMSSYCCSLCPILHMLWARPSLLAVHKCVQAEVS